MKFAKHLAKAMNVSDPEWFPYWINYKHLKKFLKLSLAWNRTTEVSRASSSTTSIESGGVIEGSLSKENREEHKKQPGKRRDGQQAALSEKERPWKRLCERYGNMESAAPLKIARRSLTCDVSEHRSNAAADTQSGFPDKTSSGTTPDASIGASSSAGGDIRCAKLSVPCAGTPHEGDEDECPFFGALLREVDKCSTFFLENEEDLKVRVQRLQLALYRLKDPVLSRLSSVKECHVKLMQSCVNFYRDALLLEDFAMVNYTAVMKLLKKRDKMAGTTDKMDFMAEVMADQPFAMYPGVASRVAQVECIFKEIENMCFIRTDAGMKSLMRAELPAVEAILKLARESQNVQDRELRDTVSATASSTSAEQSSTLHPFGSSFGQCMVACCGYDDSRAKLSVTQASSRAGTEAGIAADRYADAAGGDTSSWAGAGAGGRVPYSRASNSSSDSESANSNANGATALVSVKGKEVHGRHALLMPAGKSERGFVSSACSGNRMNEGHPSAKPHHNRPHGIAKIASEMQESAVSRA